MVPRQVECGNVPDVVHVDTQQGASLNVAQIVNAENQSVPNLVLHTNIHLDRYWRLIVGGEQGRTRHTKSGGQVEPYEVWIRSVYVELVPRQDLVQERKNLRDYAAYVNIVTEDTRRW